MTSVQGKPDARRTPFHPGSCDTDAMLMRSLLLLLHLLAATVWVGGMATIHFTVRPAAAQALQPPERLRFMQALLGHFLAWVAIAIGVLLASGIALVWEAGGFARMHASVHLMTGIGVVMVLVFAHIRLRLFVQLQRALKAGEAPAAAACLARIRHAVMLNLVLGTLVFAVALVGRVL
jgi:uncharacterized membrane protein